jgi:hypothetical protein
MITTIKPAAEVRATVDRWNLVNHVGTPVRFWPGDLSGPGRDGITSSPAWALEGHTAVVRIEGYGSCIALTHVKPKQPWVLDFRPVTLYSVHCSHCANPYLNEHGTPALFTQEELNKLTDYPLTDDEWHINEDGRALSCPDCWSVGWCEECQEQIHAWEPKNSGRPGEDWHAACYKSEED